MTTCRDIISYALKQATVIAPGEDVSSDEAADGLVALQSMYDIWVANGMFGTLSDVYKTEDYEAAEGERVSAPSGVTVTFPETVTERAGTVRAPRDLAIIETNIAGARVVKVYDRTGWVPVTDLTLASDAPFAVRGVAGLSACLARSYAEMFGGSVVLGGNTQMLARQFEGGLSSKFGTTQDKSWAEYF